MALLLLVGLLLMQQTSEREGKVNRLVEEIEVLSTGEPPIFGIDSQIRLAEILGQHDPAKARIEALNAVSRSRGLRDAASVNEMFVRIARVLAPVGFSDAEELCRSIPRRSADSVLDPMADCFEAILPATGTNDRKLDLSRAALSLGAFDTALHEDVLFQLPEEEFSSLFASIVQGFPEQDSNASEVRRLLSILRRAGARNLPLSRNGLQKVFRALDSSRIKGLSEEQIYEYSLEKAVVRAKTPREALLIQAVALAQFLDPTLAERHNPRLVAPLHINSIEDLARLQERRVRTKEEDNEKQVLLDGEPMDRPKIDGLDDEERLNLARSQKNAAMRVSLMMEVVDSKQFTPPRQLSIATDALQSVTKVPASEFKLVVLSMLGRRLLLLGDPKGAASAAREMEETFNKVCQCDSAACDSLQKRDTCADMIQSFADYLDENNIKPEDLGLSNTSLRVRLLLLELKTTITGKKRTSIFG